MRSVRSIALISTLCLLGGCGDATGSSGSMGVTGVAQSEVDAGDEAPHGANQTCTLSAPGTASCECLANFADCDGAQDNGCEVDTTSNPENCGECGFACASGLACDESECEDRITSMSIGDTNSCATTADGRVLCWGYGSMGAASSHGGVLYETDLTSSNIPVEIAVGGVEQVSVGFQYACAKDTEPNLVKCWGQSPWVGMLGGADTGVAYQERMIPGARKIAVGYDHSCAIHGNGRVYCWGLSRLGGLGDGADFDVINRAYSETEMSAVQLVRTAVSVGVSSSVSCALTGAGYLYCWGEHALPKRVADADGVQIGDAIDMCVGANHACAIRSGGEVVCWGNNLLGQLGTGGTLSHELAQTVEGLPAMEEIDCASANHACGRAADGDVYCWGSNRDGQLGQGDSDDLPHRSELVAELGRAKHVYAGRWGSCAQLESGAVYCWGRNEYGMVGVGSAEPVVATPTELTYWP